MLPHMPRTADLSRPDPDLIVALPVFCPDHKRLALAKVGTITENNSRLHPRVQMAVDHRRRLSAMGIALALPKELRMKIYSLLLHDCSARQIQMLYRRSRTNRRVAMRVMNRVARYVDFAMRTDAELWWTALCIYMVGDFVYISHEYHERPPVSLLDELEGVMPAYNFVLVSRRYEPVIFTYVAKLTVRTVMTNAFCVRVKTEYSNVPQHKLWQTTGSGLFPSAMPRIPVCPPAPRKAARTAGDDDSDVEIVD